jgi:flavin-dependent dehydrogenase
VAIGATREAKLATIVRDGRQARVSLVTRDSRTAPQDQFRELWLAAQHAGALPAAASAPQARDTPTGVALDLDSHVGKRCLLIGDAGGFVCAFSHEGIYPAMKSGCVAVEVAAAALPAPLIQDELGGFEAAWRGALADYLRMPNTDLSLLMPLVFNNEQMSRRVARAFVLGQQF